MNQIEALHTAARNYCMIRSYEMRQRYWSEAGQLLDDGELQHLTEIDRIANAMLADIESTIPGDFRSFEEARDILLLAGQIYESGIANRKARFSPGVVASERAIYINHLIRLIETPNGMNEIKPFFYRRTLGKRESKKLWAQLEERWQITGGYWYPAELIQSSPQRFAIYKADEYEDEVAPEILRDILTEHSIRRVYELYEFRDDAEYEVEVARIEPSYGSSGEQYCTSEGADWVIYSSHENAITFAGDWLVEAIRARMKNEK